ncbi:hypothetical protein B0I35DRAFT_36214 [Stachybotrys elegans]|uniref:Uncharacterized protein n=1 Tax=Stachybotrys elegans TaxID=80388 RepID=A0A8K0WYN7_9HYPO|nr:hypothetical protein B0I35DRAFT_36214 [Stachybotrys elegans]
MPSSRPPSGTLAKTATRQNPTPESHCPVVVPRLDLDLDLDLDLVVRRIQPPPIRPPCSGLVCSLALSGAAAFFLLAALVGSVRSGLRGPLVQSCPWLPPSCHRPDPRGFRRCRRHSPSFSFSLSLSHDRRMPIRRLSTSRLSRRRRPPALSPPPGPALPAIVCRACHADNRRPPDVYRTPAIVTHTPNTPKQATAHGCAKEAAENRYRT